MNQIVRNLARQLFTCPVTALGIVTCVSFMALSAALISQYFFGLHPCPLCIYQRIPYVVVIALGIIGIFSSIKIHAKTGALNLALCGVAFFVNTGIAVYHVGVEQKWWSSAACSVPDFTNLSFDEIQARIYSAPSVSCDAIAWELFGISMAGYNVLLCLTLGIYAMLAAVFVTRRSNGF